MCGGIHSPGDCEKLNQYPFSSNSQSCTWHVLEKETRARKFRNIEFPAHALVLNDLCTPYKCIQNDTFLLYCTSVHRSEIYLLLKFAHFEHFRQNVFYCWNNLDWVVELRNDLWHEILMRSNFKKNRRFLRNVQNRQQCGYYVRPKRVKVYLQTTSSFLSYQNSSKKFLEIQHGLIVILTVSSTTYKCVYWDIRAANDKTMRHASERNDTFRRNASRNNRTCKSHQMKPTGTRPSRLTISNSIDGSSYLMRYTSFDNWKAETYGLY